MKPADISLYGILDPAHCAGRDLPELARIAAANGVTILQYRDKGSDIRTMIENASAIRTALAGSSIPFIVNDRVDVALACGADGVHLGQSDMPVRDARRILGPAAIIGLSVKTVEEATSLPGIHIDHAFIGGVFETRSKDNPRAIGIEGWKEIAGLISRNHPGMPLGAIAGVTEENAGKLVKAGADGVAAISALFAADDVAAACRAMRHAVDKARKKAGR